MTWNFELRFIKRAAELFSYKILCFLFPKCKDSIVHLTCVPAWQSVLPCPSCQHSLLICSQAPLLMETPVSKSKVTTCTSVHRRILSRDVNETVRKFSQYNILGSSHLTFFYSASLEISIPISVGLAMLCPFCILAKSFNMFNGKYSPTVHIWFKDKSM